MNNDISVIMNLGVCFILFNVVFVLIFVMQEVWKLNILWYNIVKLL